MSTEASPHTAGLPSEVTCPFCGGSDTTPLATFGSLLMTSQYSCGSCNTTFEWVRREHTSPQPQPH